MTTPVAGTDLAVASDLAVAGDLASGRSGDLATTAPPADLAMTALSGARRKLITIDGSKLSGSQTDFPLWVDLTDGDIAARAEASGRDIHFVAADGKTPLDYEIQGWDVMTHHLSAWVRMPTLKAASPALLYVYYGDPSTAATPNPPAVFKAGFAAVWHLDDALPATAIADATGTHTGTPLLTTTTQTAARLGGGLAFTGGNDTISFTNPLSGNQPHTISLWLSQAAVAHPSAILVVGTAAASQARWLYGHWTSAALAVGYYNADWATTTNLDGVGLTLVHWVLEGANGKSHLYVNGAEIAGSPMMFNGINTQGASGVIGHAPEPAFGTNMGLTGTIDELRIATTARDAAWIATEYANQSSPSTFYGVGAEQAVP